MAAAFRKIEPGLEDIIRQIRLLGEEITNANSSSAIEKIIDKMQSLASCSEAWGSDIARVLVGNYTRFAYNMCGEMKLAEARMSQYAASATQGVYKINATAEPLAGALKWSAAERKRFEEINPEGIYPVVRFDDNGNVSHSEKISGQELRDSAALVKAYASKETLDAEGLRKLNEALYGHPAGHGNDKDRIQRGTKKLKKAVKDVYGDTASRENDAEKRNKIGKNLKKVLDSFDALDDLYKTKPNQPGMDKAADKIIEEEDKKLKKKLNDGLNNWSGSSEGTSEDQRKMSANISSDQLISASPTIAKPINSQSTLSV